MSDFEVVVEKGGVSARDFLASDIRAINKALIAIDPELRTQFMRDAKSVGKEAQSIVQPALPPSAPLSGMNFRGKYGWNTQMTKKGRVPATRVTVSFKTSQGKNARKMGLQTTSLVSVRVAAPMTAIIDMAGRSENSMNKGDKGSGYSYPYTDRYGNIRRHKLNGQGRAMIDKLGGKGSRYAWPAFESSQGRLSNSVLAVVEKYSVIANRKFN